MPLIDKLRGVSGAIATDIYTRHAYSRNVDPVLQGVPDVVIRPKDAAEIASIMTVANEENVAVYPRGGGDCEFGGSKPIGNGGIVLDMKRMDNVLSLDEDALVVTVEAGISWGKLNAFLAKHGLYTGCMGPGSGMTASVGGSISHHSVGGGGCAKFGACTNQLVSLEVVLPNGDIIETGSKTNVFTKMPFNRFGGGPDLAGLFCGDNGILGVKTTVSLNVFPRPPLAAYKTFVLPRHSAKAAATAFTAIRKAGIDVYDAMYLMDMLVVLGIEKGMYPLWENLKRKRGVFFYTVEANTQGELDAKVSALDGILASVKAEILGPEIADGNYAKWHYVEQGHWQTYHNLWGVVGGGYTPLTAECFCPIASFPAILDDLDAWDAEHASDMQRILDITGFRPTTGSGPIPLVDGCNVETTCGFATFGKYHGGRVHGEIEEIDLRLWRSLLERVTRHGVQWYMLGDYLSRLLVEINAIPPAYLSLLRAVKDALDPKHVLGRGKFHFDGVNES